MPKLAGRIDVDARLLESKSESRRFGITIDGEDFPWHIDASGVSVQVSDDGCPAVTITILAERVTVDHRIEGKAD
ncbi:hypothetical protein P5G50_18395 [Leifsonia sp. F6_8S_P_1B]|uniref:Uncharacterized protein n=1 Tax=Leifsonia williamsii TaxID=3035919 RepID=A0ABT8KGW4_9MICO|nr:hypothetical protein [Leifsonia williamsii]MDN4616422.1 hypothetical protein [Leifsonia williamsii]